MTDAEFREQDRGVPVGYAGGSGEADPLADEVLLQLPPGGRAFGVGEVSDGRQVGGADGIQCGQRVVGVDGQHPGQVENGPLLDAGQRLSERDPG